MRAALSPRGRRPDAPVVVNGLASLATLLVVAIFAVRVSQSAPPTIAELQPQVKQQILQAPDNQAARTGPNGGNGAEGAGASPSPGGPAGGPGASPSPSSPVIQLPRLLRCSGNPPIQTPDPQSPPCVSYFDPNTSNGGATSQGVTGQTIYIAYPDLGGFFEKTGDVDKMAAYFNHHFQFYGRQVKILDYSPNGGALGQAQISAMNQDATYVARQLNPGAGVFASLSYTPRQGAEHYYYDALKGYGILSVNSTPTATEETHYDQYAPYEWSVVPGLDFEEQNLASMVCQTLNGRAPQYVGPPAPARTWPAKRVFGIAYQREPEGSYPDLGPLTNALSACGAPVAVQEEDSGNESQVASDLQNKGVTSFLCLCGPPALGTIMGDAANQQYFPEWILQPYQFQDTDAAGSSCCGNNSYPNSQQNHQIIGLTYQNRFTAPEQQFWFQALREVDPAYAYGDNASDIYDYYRYEELMVLASGIQLAGPNLTPQSFADGLTRAHFPDPGHGQPPYYQALVGFGAGKHSFFADAAPIWWSAQDQNYTTNEPRTGSFCYVDRGLRFAAGQWPAALDFFTEPCR